MDIDMDNGNVRVYLKKGIPVIEMLHYGEFGLSDVVWIHQAIFNEITPPLTAPVDLIIDRIGDYSFSPDAYQAVVSFMRDSGRVAYVIHHPQQEVVVDLAANTYLIEHEVGKFHALDDACDWIRA